MQLNVLGDSCGLPLPMLEDMGNETQAAPAAGAPGNAATPVGGASAGLASAATAGGAAAYGPGPGSAQGAGWAIAGGAGPAGAGTAVAGPASQRSSIWGSMWGGGNSSAPAAGATPKGPHPDQLAGGFPFDPAALLSDTPSASAGPAGAGPGAAGVRAGGTGYPTAATPRPGARGNTGAEEWAGVMGTGEPPFSVAATPMAPLPGTSPTGGDVVAAAAAQLAARGPAAVVVESAVSVRLRVLCPFSFLYGWALFRMMLGENPCPAADCSTTAPLRRSGHIVCCRTAVCTATGGTAGPPDQHEGAVRQPRALHAHGAGGSLARCCHAAPEAGTKGCIKMWTCPCCQLLSCLHAFFQNA